MRKPKLILIISVLLLVANDLCAQWAVSSAGGGVAGSTGSVDFTLGEVAIQNFSLSGGSIGEGVQQPYVHPVTDTIFASLCVGQSYQQYGFDISSEETSIVGTRTYSRVDSIGSVVVLVLTVNSSSAYVETITACDSLLWHGITYYNSIDDVTWQTTNVYGCDSVVTLHLQIGHRSNNTTMEAQASESYVWEGTTYTASGVYSRTFTNALGCDSVVQLKLSILDKPLPHIYAYSDKAVLVDHFPKGEDQNRVDYISYRWYQDDIRKDLVCGDVYSEYENGCYQVLSGCYYVEVPTDYTLAYWVKSNTVCIQPSQKESDDLILAIYPNPTSAGNDVHVSLSDKCLDGEIQLYDVMGRQLVSQTITDTYFTIQVPQHSGAYTIRIKSIDGESSVRKIIVR